MGTIVRLDANRTTCIEQSYHLYRHSGKIHLAFGGKSVIHQWATGSWTLQPVNATPAFTETDTWEALKFRLSDCIYSPDWWDETYRFTADNVKFDHYFNAKVPSIKVPPPSNDLLQELVNIFGTNVAIDMALQEGQTARVLYSKGAQPANQGYFIRWHQDGHPDDKASKLFDFYFGEYALRVNGDGTAEVWNTLDDQTYATHSRWTWNPTPKIHGDYHEITIYPHGRNCIEFVGLNHHTHEEIAEANPKSSVSSQFALGQQRTLRGWVMRVPGKIVNGQITKAAPWRLDVNRNYRPFVQISRLGFLNGPADIHDEPQHMGYPPVMKLNMVPDVDLNGCSFTCSLVNYDTRKPWVEDGKTADTFTFKGQFQGRGDFANGQGSFETPELLGYVIEKPPLLNRSTLETKEFKVMQGIDMDHGDAPESERLTISLDNSRGELDAYRRRAHIPIDLVDEATGAILFQGTCWKVRYFKNKKSGYRLQLEVKGMADKILRTYPFDMDFSVDPSSASLLPYHWQDVTQRILESCAFRRDTEVAFRDALGQDGTVWDFPLWPDGETEDTGGKKDPSSPQSRWRPNPQVPVYQFLDSVIRDHLGWHWHWNRKEQLWEVYKRPRPADLPKRPTVARFFGTVEAVMAARNDGRGIPCYLHQDYEEESERPEATTFGGYTIQNTPQRKTRGELLDLQQRQQQSPDITDTAYNEGPHMVVSLWDNPNGYPSKNHPNPDTTSPDYLIDQHFRALNLTMAGNRDAYQFLGQRAYEDLCHGYVYGSFLSDWGDTTLAYLKKWDPVEIDGERFLIDRVEPSWKSDKVRRAKYRCSLERADAPPPY